MGRPKLQMIEFDCIFDNFGQNHWRVSFGEVCKTQSLRKVSFRDAWKTQTPRRGLLKGQILRRPTEIFVRGCLIRNGFHLEWLSIRNGLPSVMTLE